ncbi:MAG: alpha/beta hydrolase family protein [Blastocatellales bacterium]
MKLTTHTTYRLVGTLLITLMIAIAIKPLKTSAKVVDPMQMGPFPVGVTTTVFVDHSRTDAATNEARTLVTEIWYPASDDARDLPKTKFTDFIPGGLNPQFEALLKMAYKKSADQINAAYWTSAVRDARVREGKFPLIVFSHGNGGSRFQNTFWCDYLASHGYIIVSADHTANARVTVIKGKPIIYRNDQRENSAVDRPKDMSFLLDQMTLWNGGADSRFSGRLDLSKPVAAGMSFGSMTAIRVADADPRFKAVIAMSGAPEAHNNLTVPSLYMLGDEDRTIGPKGNARILDVFAKHQRDGFLLEMKDGGHYSFTDIFKLDKNFGDGAGPGKRGGEGEPFTYTSMETTYSIINSYSIAFLGAYVRGEREYLPFLQKNHWPKELNWQAKGMEQSQSAGAK